MEDGEANLRDEKPFFNFTCLLGNFGNFGNGGAAETLSDEQ